MKKFSVFLISIIVLLITSCDKEESMSALYLDKVSGYVQKGPFLNGTTISVYELSNNHLPTGRIYTSQILDNIGSFEFKNLSLTSEYVELIANGFYFNEVNNESSSAQLTLYALSDLTDKTTLNVNVLSHLEKRRVEFLISNGISFNDAKKQAQSEILKIFEIQKIDIIESEDLDISHTGEDNAILLAISLILQGYLPVSDLSELLANISTDILEDGILNSNSLGEILINNATVLQTDEIRNNLESRYEFLGMDIGIPEFEKFVKQFIDSTEYIATNHITYPTVVHSKINILVDSSFIMIPGITYSVGAYLPIGTSIKVICKPTYNVDWGAFGVSIFEAIGFTLENNYPDNITMTAKGNDETVTVPVMFGESAPVSPTSIDFVIYENNSEDYTRLKTVTTF